MQVTGTAAAKLEAEKTAIEARRRREEAATVAAAAAAAAALRERDKVSAFSK